MATKKIKRFQEGGMSDKERGLEASKDDKVGFFERLRMGNIDDEGSEAYRRFGAGRGRAESVPVEDRTPTPVIRESAKPTPAIQEPAKPTPSPMDAMGEANKREPIPVPTGPKAKPSAPIKAAPKPSVKNEYAASPKKDTSSYSNEGRSREMTKEQQFKFADEQARTPAGVARRKQMEKDQAIERIYPEEMLVGGPSLKALQNVAKKMAGTGAKKAAESGGSRAVSTAVDDGVTFLGKSGRRQVGGFDELPAPAAKSIADGTRKATSGEAGKKSLPSPTKRLAYDKAGAIAKRRADRASKRRDEMLDENAKNYGLDPKAPGYEAASGAVRKELGGKDFTFKKGGKVKSMKMSSGGSTSPASKRADGIATRGKTRCKIC